MRSLAVFAVLCVVVPNLVGGDHPPWSYHGDSGPEHWGHLDPAFALCASGRQQSPIDLTGQTELQAKRLVFDYGESALELVNNGHTVQANIREPMRIMVDGQEYRLLQFHFHAPSEHRRDGKSYPLCAHFVHQNAQGQLAVVGLFFEVGDENQVLAPVFNHLPAKSGTSKVLDEAIQISHALPDDHAHFSYAGSLTTPPCSEGVSWFVMLRPVSLSSAQLEAFTQLYSANARPVQARNERKISKTEH